MKRATALAFVLAMAISACGGGDGDETVSAAPVLVAEEDQTESANTMVAEVDSSNTGDTTDSADSTEPDVTEATDEERALDFVACMRDNGVDFPDPAIGADGSVDLLGNAAPGSIDPNTDEFQAAVEVCGEIVAGASFLPGAQADPTEQQANLLAFAACLRGLGYDVIDPVLSDIQADGPGALTRAFGENFDPTDPANSDAVQQCQAEIQGATDE